MMANELVKSLRPFSFKHCLAVKLPTSTNDKRSLLFKFIPGNVLRT